MVWVLSSDTHGGRDLASAIVPTTNNTPAPCTGTASAGPAMRFHVASVCEGVIALQCSATGKWLCAEPDGRVVCDRSVVGVCEAWQVGTGLDWGTLSLRSCHGRYLCMDPGSGVLADRPGKGLWESLRMEAVDSEDGAALPHDIVVAMVCTVRHSTCRGGASP